MLSRAVFERDPFRSAAALAVLAAGVVMVRSAWIGDDAYITLRTVSNFVHGFGLTWNIAERAQAYTHPLWMFVLSAGHLISGEAYYTTIIISLLISLATVFLFAFRLSRGYVTAVAGVLILMLSKPFIDYSTSGLENPLSHLLIVVFFIVLFRQQNSHRTVFRLALVTGLAATNRLDILLLLGPILLVQVWKLHSRRAVTMALYGLTPLLAWELFSLWYYGSLISNTAYAKLSTGIAQVELIRHAGYYFENALDQSPSTSLPILLAMGAGWSARDWTRRAAAISILLYLLYVASFGGGFMAGRFLTAPFVCAMALLSQNRLRPTLRPVLLTGIAIIIVGAVWPRSPLWVGTDYGTGDTASYWERGITDERAAYYPFTGLLVQPDSVLIPKHPWARQGREMSSAGDTVVQRAGIGMFGYFAGPRVHIIGGHALADPLLSRLPIADLGHWRIGHYFRPLPTGYLESCVHDSNMLRDRSLAAYYDVVRTITRGKLWSRSRMWTIIRNQLGVYDHLLDDYLSGPKLVVIGEMQIRRVKGTPYNARWCKIFDEHGLLVVFDGVQHHRRLEVSRDHNDVYSVAFRLDGQVVDSTTLPYIWIPERGLSIDTLVVDSAAAASGYNELLIVPVSGDETYSFGHVIVLPD